jgi:hypothetical protein
LFERAKHQNKTWRAVIHSQKASEYGAATALNAEEAEGAVGPSPPPSPRHKRRGEGATYFAALLCVNFSGTRL